VQRPLTGVHTTAPSSTVAEGQSPAIAVVIPARNAASLLPESLDALARQLAEGDALIVVDDGSTDDTAAVAAACGATVLRRDQPGGPYAARNDGWLACDQPYVLFTDTRCVARDGLLTALRGPMSEGTDLVFGDILIREGPRLAHRAAAQRQHLRIAFYERDTFLPFFPTACLGVRRRALEDVGGFRVSASGGDADLCWRVQLAGHDRVAFVRDTLMDWQPRDAVGAWVEQWRKYGTSNAQLRVAYSELGAAIPPMRPRWRMTLSYLLQLGRGAIHARNVDALAVLGVNLLADFAFERAYRHELRALQRGSTPRVFAAGGSLIPGQGKT
jgi:cellulose synthase/poly-beta-1,6-N-acetylglucosamine synthase-like glycosyltransferase